jgi:hypothetical protein
VFQDAHWTKFSPADENGKFPSQMYLPLFMVSTKRRLVKQTPRFKGEPMDIVDVQALPSWVFYRCHRDIYTTTTIPRYELKIIECAFGMLTERWAILRSAMPKNLQIHNINRLVQAFSTLHNFVFDRQELSAGELHPHDFASLIRNSDGYVSLVLTEYSNEPVPLQQVEGGSRKRQYVENLPLLLNPEAIYGSRRPITTICCI